MTRSLAPVAHGPRTEELHRASFVVSGVLLPRSRSVFPSLESKVRLENENIHTLAETAESDASNEAWIHVIKLNAIKIRLRPAR